jgi:hypothetical protein
MSFRVFPDQLNAPMWLRGGTTSGFVAFDEMRSSLDGGSMFLRLVKLSGACRPPGGPAPKILLRARTTTGAPPDENGKLIPQRPTTTPIVNRKGLGVAPVARASYEVRPMDVYLIQVDLIGSEVSDWGIKIANEDSVERGFTWVVADSAEQTEQSWINVGDSLAIKVDVAPGGRASGQESIQIANLGTGDLTLAAQPASASGRFTLGPLPSPIRPNSCGTLQITFEGIAANPDAAESLVLASNDPRADGSAEHNAEIALSGASRVLVPVEPQEPVERFPCKVRGCTCDDLLDPVQGICQRGGCHHAIGQHKLPI